MTESPSYSLAEQREPTETMTSAKTSTEGFSPTGTDRSLYNSDSDLIISNLSDQLHTLQLNEIQMRQQITELTTNHKQLLTLYEELHQELHDCHLHDKETFAKKLGEIRKLISSL